MSLRPFGRLIPKRPQNPNRRTTRHNVMKIRKRISKQRERRAYRVRNGVRHGGRPRLSVFRSNRHIYAQVIDDQSGRTLVAASSMEQDLAEDGSGGNRASAEKIGQAIGKRAVDAGIKEVCFDRGRYKYHGRVAALAEAAREAGLQF